MVIPAGQEEYDYVNVCPSGCTQRLLPPSGAKVVSAMLHMHLHGRGGAIEVSPGLKVDATYYFDACKPLNSTRLKPRGHSPVLVL